MPTSAAVVPSCDGCRHCPSTYPSKGVTGDAAWYSLDFGWEGTCVRGHSVGILREWEGIPEEPSLVRSVLAQGFAAKVVPDSITSWIDPESLISGIYGL